MIDTCTIMTYNISHVNYTTHFMQLLVHCVVVVQLIEGRGIDKTDDQSFTISS